MKKIRVSKEDKKIFVIVLKEMLDYFKTTSGYPFLCMSLDNYKRSKEIKNNLQRILIYNLINPPDFISENKYFRPCLNEDFAGNQSYWCRVINERIETQADEMKAERIKFIEYLINKYEK